MGLMTTPLYCQGRLAESMSELTPYHRTIEAVETAEPTSSEVGLAEIRHAELPPPEHNVPRSAVVTDLYPPTAGAASVSLHSRHLFRTLPQQH